MASNRRPRHHERNVRALNFIIKVAFGSCASTSTRWTASAPRSPEYHSWDATVFRFAICGNSKNNCRG